MPAARPHLSPIPRFAPCTHPNAEDFARDGCIILKNFADASTVDTLARHSRALLNPLYAPVEYESEVQYPGAPKDRASTGGQTPRRLLFACGRHPDFRAFATSPAISNALKTLAFGPGEQILLSQNHHNCVMTKMPEFSSETGWHQDIRYWNFQEQELVTAWLALSHEVQENGALQVIPGSHRRILPATAFDGHKFFLDESPENRELLAQARVVELEPGDLLLFHCRLLHAALRNAGDKAKLAFVTTYRKSQDLPKTGTRSARFPDIPI